VWDLVDRDTLRILKPFRLVKSKENGLLIDYLIMAYLPRVTLENSGLSCNYFSIAKVAKAVHYMHKQSARHISTKRLGLPSGGLAKGFL